MLPNMLLPDFTTVVEIITSMVLGRTAGGKLFPGFVCQQPVVSVEVVALDWQDCNGAITTLFAKPLNEGLAPNCPPMTWSAQECPQKVTELPTCGGELLPPQITKVWLGKTSNPAAP